MKDFIFKYNNMPVLRPVPISTKHGSYFKRLLGWFTTRHWVVEKNFYFRINNLSCLIPRGFVFDGASVPRIFWLFLHPTGILLIPGLIHDYGYKNLFLYRYSMKEEEDKLIIQKHFLFKDQRRWDILFLQVAIAVNGFKIINRVAYIVLRVCGWYSFKKHRKNDV